MKVCKLLGQRGPNQLASQWAACGSEIAYGLREWSRLWRLVTCPECLDRRDG